MSIRVLLGGGAAAVAARWQEDEFTATPAQTVFTLRFTPLDLDTVTVRVNGVLYDDVADWTVLATTLTWLDTPFALAAGDSVIARYIR